MYLSALWRCGEMQLSRLARVAFPWEIPSLPFTKLPGTFLLFLLLRAGHRLLRTAEGREQSKQTGVEALLKTSACGNLRQPASRRESQERSICTGKRAENEE